VLVNNMSATATIPRSRRPELLIRPLGEEGRHVVKDPATDRYFQLGQHESFLLLRLDGQQTSEAICREFATRFGEPFSPDDLSGFLMVAESQGLLAPEPLPEFETEPDSLAPDGGRSRQRVPRPARPLPKNVVPKSSQQSLFFWRKKLFDPNRLFNYLCPKIQWVWTPAFLAVTFAFFLAAQVVFWTNNGAIVDSFKNSLRWETLLFAGITILAVTTCHEFAHGLTCKRHGGEVHEVGFLLLYLIPGFYCNVSDAWLIREKSKRLWITAAGAYCDLCLWSLAIFVWRISYQDSLLNYLATVVLSVTGVRSLFNLNPVIKLDGYYLLGDYLEIPNLSQTAYFHWMSHLRAVLWGGARPRRPSQHPKFLFIYGMCSWLFSIGIVCLMFYWMGKFWHKHLGGLGVGMIVPLALLVGNTLFRDVFTGENGIVLLLKRHVRAAVWLSLIGGTIAGLTLIPITDRATGTFEIKPVKRAELRAEVSGFLHEVRFDEGEQVKAGTLLAQMAVPDLQSKIDQKEAELKEGEAKLSVLRLGSRKEVLSEQRERVARAETWRKMAAQDLVHRKKSLEQQLIRLDHTLAQYEAERTQAASVLARAESLLKSKTMSPQEYGDKSRDQQICKAKCEQARAEKASLQSLGTLEAETELGRRERDLAEEKSKLKLLEIGTRPEEIAASNAQMARLKVELDFLKSQQEKLPLITPLDGVMITPRLKQKCGQYFQQGEMICEVEDQSALEVEITLPDQESAPVRPGQVVYLKARAIPFDIFKADVIRVASRGVTGELQNTFKVYATVREPNEELRSGMGGYARIYCDSIPVGQFILKRLLHLLRTEVWW
jgi:putative peptide zinc metalloprotease protein